MRPWLWILVGVLGCGNSADKSPTPRVAIGSGDEDPPCDPAKPKVCLADDVVACEANGRLGRRLRACHHGCELGTCKGTCSDEAVKLIYLVDSGNELLSFDPRLLPKDPFRVIGTLTCERGTPFSMSIDRNGIAWVVYGDGQLFKVDITDAHCESAGYDAGSTGSATFGMGFTTDTPGSDTEKLFIAADNGTRALHAIDTANDVIPWPIGTIAAGTTRNPELTGGGDAKLFGFFPEEGAVAFVQEIDRTNGKAVGPRWPLGSAPLGEVTAYAFARWAGVFYIFVTTTNGDFESESTVRTIDPATGDYRTLRRKLPFRVTGAGVSTCAPERDAKGP